MRKLLVVVIFVSLFSLPLLAQDKVEVFGGYQYLHTGNLTVSGQSVPDSSQGFNGWDASVRGYFHKDLGVEGDFGGAYATISGVSAHVYTYTGGPVVSLNTGGKVNPYGHGLFGGVRLGFSNSGVSVSENGFTMMFGGGVDVKANRSIAIRLIQADWVYYHFGSNTIAGEPIPSFSGSNNVRVLSGVVFRF